MDLGELLKDIKVPVKVSYFKVTFAYQPIVTVKNESVQFPVGIAHFDWYGKTNPYVTKNLEDLVEIGKNHAVSLCKGQMGNSFISLSYFTLVGIIPVV